MQFFFHIMGLLKKQRLYILTAPPGRDKETKRDKVKVYIEYIILYYIQNIYIYIYVYVYVNNRSFGCNITIIHRTMSNNNASKMIMILL